MTVSEIAIKHLGLNVRLIGLDGVPIDHNATCTRSIVSIMQALEAAYAAGYEARRVSLPADLSEIANVD